MIKITHQEYWASTRYQFGDGGESIVPLRASDIIRCYCKTTAHMTMNFVQPQDITSPAMQRGKLRHALLLRQESWSDDIAVIDCDSWKTKFAQDMKAEAESAGKMAVLLKDFEVHQRVVQKISRARPKLWEQILAGTSEQGLVWLDKKTGLWCKALHDSLAADGQSAIDFKTTPGDRDYGLTVWDKRNIDTGPGLIRAGHYLESMQYELARLTYLVQESDHPHFCADFELDMMSPFGERALTEWRHALDYTHEALVKCDSKLIDGLLPERVEGVCYPSEYR